ncbi:MULTISPECIES: GntR family transcriptional regulator [Chelatococcus]|uniref:DNA-binding GntR family transcriptional regulator n=1 Tax=Chelatococcus caeni TaxID=1348468 RepID=A0A840BZP0_9HYPH|nr:MULTISPECIES: GntR family transcriptional regulator [Chelatococcus]ALA20224.1 transcriptional regulator [Chelatococcus sp. CO-6]MBB4019021.1 DNA-binding GntR family transcriptional regulator [Chelatococcus caeni]
MTAKADGTAAALVDIMARDIQAGVFAAGAWLKQIDLERRYGATRMDVRRALDQLALKRLVRHVPNRGYHVHALDDRQADEIRELRVVLESAAAPSMVRNATAADIAELRALARRFEELILTGTLLEQYEANIAFHVRLLRLCSNRELINMALELRGRGPSAPATQWKTRARIEQSGREHFMMVDALAAGDADLLRSVIAAHIQQSEAQTTL